MDLAAFADRITERVRRAAVSPDVLGPHAVAGSLYSGGAGVAYFLFERARLRGEPRVLRLAERWCIAARAWSRASPIPCGFLTGDAGLAYVEALLAGARGDARGVSRAVRRLDVASRALTAVSPPLRRTELLYGGAGVLCAMRGLDRRLPDGALSPQARARLDDGRRRLRRALLIAAAPPLAPGPDDELGLAHGLAGELWCLIGEVGVGHARVRARLEELAALGAIDGDGLVYWLARTGDVDEDLLPTWCNGMAGHALLWTEVARRSRSDEARQLADLSVRSLAALPSPKHNLCCGLAGQARALDRHAVITGDPRSRALAEERLVRAVEVWRSGRYTSTLGLFKGDLGLALAALLHVQGDAEFPLIDAWGVSSDE